MHGNQILLPDPAEAFPDSFAEPLTHGVARMAGGASIDGR